MLLSETVEALINKLGAGTLNESTIKGQLSLIYDQAKAQEAEIETKQAKIQQLEKSITQLEVKLHKQEQTEPAKMREGRLDELSEKILKMLFDAQDDDNDGILTSGEMAQGLGVKKGVANQRCGLLYKAEMINAVGFDSFYIIQNGSDYVVKFLLT